MAHGIAGTRDCGLLPFAEAFSGAGLDVVLFDYRCFGESSGEPRQLASPPRHRDDYRAAVEFARDLNGVDPERIVLWGSSWSGGHVVYVAAEDPRVTAVIAQTPDLDGIRTLREISNYAGWGQLARITREGLKDLARAARGLPPHMIPVVAPAGRTAAIASPDGDAGYHAIAGPTWRNELAARAVIAENANRAITRIESIRCPILIQIADRDTIAPPSQARAGAWRAKGYVEVREYPCEHFDIYLGWRDRAIADQLHFLRRHLGAADPARPAAAEPEPAAAAE
jgi:pimeloyl-ACP methyl ester carboxylesterase